MTVRNTNYSSLDEVWGDTQSLTASTSSKNGKRKDKKERRERVEPPKVVDPICELYEMGNYRGYNENDIINYANEYHNKYLEKENKPTYSPKSNITYDHDEYEYDEQEYRQKPSIVNNQESNSLPSQQKDNHDVHRRDKKKYIDDDEGIAKEHNEFAFVDLLLYIISGVILIFVMEQFVKIGILLQ